MPEVDSNPYRNLGDLGGCRVNRECFGAIITPIIYLRDGGVSYPIPRCANPTFRLTGYFPNSAFTASGSTSRVPAVGSARRTTPSLASVIVSPVRAVMPYASV